jgi:tetratricopeptide (TPR) repeat protein
LLEPVAADPATFRFAHALVREAIEEGLGHNGRMGLHLAAARALTRGVRPSALAQVAHHFWVARALAPADAATYARLAGVEAMAVFAFEEAVEHFERALAADQRAGAARFSETADVLLDLARAHAGAGHVAEAASTARRAADLAIDLGLPRQLARAALCFEGEIVTGGDFWFAQLELLETAARYLGDGTGTDGADDPALLARLLAMLAHVRVAMHPESDVTAVSDRAVALAERAGDDAAMAAAVQSRRHVLALPDNTPERVDLSRRVIEHGVAAEEVAWAMLGRHALLADLLELGSMGRFEHELGRYVEAARDLRRPHDLWRAQVMQAMLALFRGDLDQGEVLAGRAHEVGERLEQPGALQSFVIQSFFVATERGTVEAVVPFAEAWAAQRGTVATWRASLALAYCEVGRLDDAEDVFGEIAADGFHDVAHDNLWLATLGLSGEVAWRLGDQRSAAALHERLAPHGDRNVTIGTALAFGAAVRVCGLLSATVGRLDDAVAELERAVSRNEQMGSDAWAARARRDLAGVLRARGGDADIARADELDRAVADHTRRPLAGDLEPS